MLVCVVFVLRAVLGMSLICTGRALIWLGVAAADWHGGGGTAHIAGPVPALPPHPSDANRHEEAGVQHEPGVVVCMRLRLWCHSSSGVQGRPWPGSGGAP